MLHAPPLVLLFETDIICQIYYNCFNTKIKITQFYLVCNSLICENVNGENKKDVKTFNSKRRYRNQDPMNQK